MAVTARVYVWYPADGNIGHAALHIGDHRERNNSQWYVSWWPEESAGFTDTMDASPATQEDDEGQEGGPAHVVYTISDLSIAKMKAAWNVIRNKPEAHYRLLPKNCSTIVARVLRAGGATDLIPGWQALSYGHNLYWTPKDVAQLCDKLKDSGHATKVKSARCPTKGKNKMFVMMGLR